MLFINNLPDLIKRFSELSQYVYCCYENTFLPDSVRMVADTSIASMEKETQLFVEKVVGMILATVSYSIGLAISPILAFYILFDWEKIRKKFLYIVPRNWHRAILSFSRDADQVLGGIIRGQLSIAFIVGALASIGLYFMGVQFSFLIGIIAGLFDIIPYFGAIIGAMPAIFMAALQSPTLAMKVALLFLFIHQLEGSVIQPKILGEIIGLHPLTVIFFVFIGGELAGVFGMLIGVPIGAFLKLVLRHILKALL